ncbi:hypothetical protein [Xylophilus sp. Leaf220]|nr:hypothetical protein [Xylophilus sp. Leaf220]
MAIVSMLTAVTLTRSANHLLLKVLEAADFNPASHTGRYLQPYLEEK